MGKIRGKHNKSTDTALRMALVRAGIRGWQMYPADVPGKPDVYFIRKRLAVFVDGCFWHGCPKCGHIPRTNRPFWKAKILRNQERDRRTTRKLTAIGIRVVRMWEHSLQKPYMRLPKRLAFWSGQHREPPTQRLSDNQVGRVRYGQRKAHST
jgi:DNA mismatch endonuclease, patch repair protein